MKLLELGELLTAIAVLERVTAVVALAVEDDLAPADHGEIN